MRFLRQFSNFRVKQALQNFQIFRFHKLLCIRTLGELETNNYWRILNSPKKKFSKLHSSHPIEQGILPWGIPNDGRLSNQDDPLLTYISLALQTIGLWVRTSLQEKILHTHDSRRQNLTNHLLVYFQNCCFSLDYQKLYKRNSQNA